MAEDARGIPTQDTSFALDELGEEVEAEYSRSGSCSLSCRSCQEDPYLVRASDHAKPSQSVATCSAVEQGICI
jgi:hypothetical protein